MSTIEFKTEQEAAVAILFAAVLNQDSTLTQSQIENLSRMLVLSSRFRGTELNDLTVNALAMQSIHGSNKIIEVAAPLIQADFKETLFAMTCELLTADGRITPEESEVLAMIALFLGLSMDLMKTILTTYLIRNKWNVEIIETEES